MSHSRILIQESARLWSKRGVIAEGVGRLWGFGDFSGVIHSHCKIFLSSLGEDTEIRYGCMEIDANGRR